MYDLSVPNEKPGVCAKCKGSGTYSWGASINGQMSRSGPCYSCKNTGKQSDRQIQTNLAYNRHKVAMICQGWGGY